ncbi:MAG: B12-binding domain-containing radical SAM protein [Patescibacteria group bacterium]
MFIKTPRILLVQPLTPPSYWGFQESVKFLGARAALPPLPLITVAGLLPRQWQYRLVDLNIETLTDKDLQWADYVLLTGMIIHRDSMKEVLARCRAIGVKTIVGGPFVSSSPDASELTDADTRVIGELEDQTLLATLVSDLRSRALRATYRAHAFPDLGYCRVPRFDLLDVSAYTSLSIQVSRGCPHRCEFCNVRMLNGNRPRYKSTEEARAELDAVYATGFQGNVFIVDDNFIGNVYAVMPVLDTIVAWQLSHHFPFLFYTEADIRLADMPELVNYLVSAGFFAVFIGFESPSKEALEGAKKHQNLKIDPVQAVSVLRQHGLLVYGGFIVGFDSDGPDCFDATVEFVEKCAVDFAMVGMLMAIPGTPLYDRLAQEGRLRTDDSGDQFAETNVIPLRMTQRQLVAGYRKLLQQIYNPSRFFARAARGLREWTPRVHRPYTWQEVGAVFRSFWWQGVLAPYRLAYWRFILQVTFNNPANFGRAIAIAASGYHFFAYTREVVVPRLIAAERRL